MIHPTAVVHARAQVHPSVQLGPYAVIDADVTIGPDCWMGPYVHVTGRTTIGRENRFHAGCVIGDAPQDLKYQGQPTRLTIGDRNTFREHVTVHRSNCAEEETRVGSDNLLMAHSHVGHNAMVGNGVIVANGAQLSGHVALHDRAFISGNCLVHQFVRVGSMALMQGGAAISLDLPPFTIARGYNGMCGLNVVGLRRAGFSPEARLELKRVYQMLFRGKRRLSVVLEEARRQFDGEASRILMEFVLESRRGLCRDTSRKVKNTDAAEADEIS